jgi:hypothetical protein
VGDDDEGTTSRSRREPFDARKLGASMTISRRVFLARAGVLVAVPVAISLSHSLFSGCSDDDPCGDADRVEETATTLVVTSRCADGHTHTFTLTQAELFSPPPLGIDRATEPYSDDGHVHHLELTELEMMRIEAGDTVLVTSSITDGHAHVFALHGMSDA